MILRWRRMLVVTTLNYRNFHIQFPHPSISPERILEMQMVCITKWIQHHLLLLILATLLFFSFWYNYHPCSPPYHRDYKYASLMTQQLVLCNAPGCCELCLKESILPR